MLLGGDFRDVVLEQYNQLLWIRVLTLRGLSLFF